MAVVDNKRHKKEMISIEEEKFKTLIEQSNDAFYLLYNDKFEIINGRFQDLFGYSLSECRDSRFNFRKLVSDDSLPMIEKRLNQLKKGEAVNPIYEFTAVSKDGSEIECEVCTSKVDYKGEMAIQGIIRDISYRKKSEEKLKSQEASYRELFNSATDSIYVQDIDGSFLDLNDGAVNMYGYPKELLIGKKPDFLSAPGKNEMAYIMDCFQKALNGTPQVFEFWGQRKDGEIFPKIVRLQKGEYFGREVVIAFSIDMSEQKKSEIALQESEAKARALLNAQKDDIVLLDTEGTILDANLSFSKQVRRDFDQIKGVKLSELYPKRLVDIHQPYIDSVLDTAEAVSFTDEYAGRWYDVILYPITDSEHNVAKVALISRDITSQKEAEAERKKLEGVLHISQKMEAIGTLAGGFAHNFNNLLMAIQGYAGLMQKEPNLTNRAEKFIGNIEEAVKNGSALTKELLGFARGGKYSVEPTDINELIRHESDLFVQTKKEVKVIPKFDPYVWTVEVDKGQLQQVFLNLFVNSWQAMESGGEIYIQTENKVIKENYIQSFKISPGNYVKISVTDTGTGMDEETRQKVFEPFFTTKEGESNTGLGLASVYGIIKNHHGFINVYSEVGVGTTFTIYLPASDKAVLTEPTSPSRLIEGEGTILIVDDEYMVRDVGREILEILGYDVLSAESGKEAIELFHTHQKEIKLVVLDLIMPGIGGEETFEALKKVDPEVKVLLSSGYSLNGRAEKIMQRGCKGFLQKPFTLNEFSEKISTILSEGS